MGKLEQISKQLDQAWEDLIYDRCTLLPTLMDVDLIDARWLPYLKPLLGFTDDISFAATTEELRRILNRAVPYWNEKPTELGVISNAVRMVTGNRFRVANWFDFRMQIDQTCITEEMENFDPYAVGFYSKIFLGTLGGGLISVYDPAKLTFVVVEYPTNFTKREYNFLVIDKDTTDPLNEGVYRIDVPAGNVEVFTTTPFHSTHSNPVSYRLLAFSEEYVSEVRVVDEGIGVLYLKNITSPFGIGEKVVGVESGATAWITAVGTSSVDVRSIVGRFDPNEAVTDTGGGAASVKSLDGVLNRELLAFLMGGRTVRPFSERIDVVYINFLDEFRTPGDLDQWEVNDIALMSIVAPAGPCRVLEGGYMTSVDPTAAYWWDQVTAWKITPVTATTSVDLRFMVQDIDNQYHVAVDYNIKAVSLYKVVAGTPTQIGSSAILPYLKAGVQDVIRVDALQEGTGLRVRVRVNGELELDEIDDPFAFNQGQVGIAAVVSDVDWQLVEVNVLPTEVERVGPNP